MSDTRSIVDLLHAVRRRLRSNRILQASVDAATWLLGLLLAFTLWNALMPVRLGLGWPLLGAAALAVVGVQLVRLGAAEPLARTASRADELAGLQDELTSAHWFSRQPDGDPMVRLHLDRAAERARTLEPSELVPRRTPRRWGLPVALVVAVLAVSLAPVPRVFDDIARRLAAIDLGGEPEISEEPLASLEELGDREPELEPMPENEEFTLPTPSEGEPTGEQALEEQDPMEGGEQEAEPQEGEQPGQQGEQLEQADEQAQQAEAGEEPPEGAETEMQGEPSGSPEDGEGEATDQEGPMLPAGDEVFLQEGGEDVEQQQLGEEEVGHATRQGGGEEQLEAGEISTLEVQLEREILEVPEEAADPEAEDPEELVTRAERSFLRFEDVEAHPSAAVQELLQSESIPWRYRQLVLQYFQALRQRDNQKPEQESE